LAGLEPTYHDGRIVGKLSAQPISSTSLTSPEIMKLIGAFVRGEDEFVTIAPKEEHQVIEAISGTRVVDTSTSTPRTPNSTPAWATLGVNSEKGMREHSSDRDRRSTPPSSPTGGGVHLKFLPTGFAILAKCLAKLATTPIGNVRLGMEVVTTHHQGENHQNVVPAKKGSCHVTLTAADVRLGERKWATLHQIIPKIPPIKHRMEKER